MNTHSSALTISLVIETTRLLRPFLIYIGLSNFFFLNLFFLMNSKLITNLVILLSNNASTTIPSLSSSYFDFIFTVTSLNNFFSFSTLLLLFSAPIIHTSTSFSFFNLFSLKIVFLYFPIFLLLPSPMFITLLFNTSNLFENISIDPSSPLFFIFIQLQVMCPNPLQTKHFLFIITLSLFSCLLISHISYHLYFFSAFLSSLILIFSTLLYLSSILFFSSSLLLLLFPFFFFVLLSPIFPYIPFSCFLFPAPSPFLSHFFSLLSPMFFVIPIFIYYLPLLFSTTRLLLLSLHL